MVKHAHGAAGSSFSHFRSDSALEGATLFAATSSRMVHMWLRLIQSPRESLGVRSSLYEDEEDEEGEGEFSVGMDRL